MPDIKTLEQISREEWIVNEWLDVTRMEDGPQRRYVLGRERSPNEVEGAARGYDLLMNAKEDLT